VGKNTTQAGGQGMIDGGGHVPVQIKLKTSLIDHNHDDDDDDDDVISIWSGQECTPLQ